MTFFMCGAADIDRLVTAFSKIIYEVFDYYY